MAKPKIELFRDDTGTYRFRLKAANGRILAVSKGYSSKQNLEKEIKNFNVSVEGAKVVEVKNNSKEIQKEKKIENSNLPWIIGMVFGLGVLLFAFLLILINQLGLISL